MSDKTHELTLRSHNGAELQLLLSNDEVEIYLNGWFVCSSLRTLLSPEALEEIINETPIEEK